MDMDGGRPDDDYYPTPPALTMAMLEHEQAALTRLGIKRIWEPACGAGHISHLLTQLGYQVEATDLYDRGYGTPGVNFLHQSKTAYPNIQAIITNPPFSILNQFIEVACQFKHIDYICLFSKLATLETIQRSYLLEKTKLSRVLVLRERVVLTRQGVDARPGGSGLIPFAWFVWERVRGNSWGAPPTIHWITAQHITPPPEYYPPLLQPNTNAYQPALL